MRLSKSVPSNVAPASRRLSGRHPAFPFRLPLIFLCVALPLSTVAGKTQRTPPLDPGYLFALATADHYLQAWQSGDVETGMALLTNHAKEKVTTDILEDVFSAPVLLLTRLVEARCCATDATSFPLCWSVRPWGASAPAAGSPK